MNTNFRSGLFMLVAGALTVSCANYNVTDDFTAEPDPDYVIPYKEFKPVKSYIDRSQYPNMTVGAALNVTEFNKQELAHAAAVTNFDNATFGASLMSGKIVNAKGVMNFINMRDLLDHVEEIGYEVYGSPIVANANQADEWLKTITAPVEVPVEFVEGKKVDFNTMSVGSYVDGAGTKAEIVKYDDKNQLKIGKGAKVRIIEGFEVDPLAKYTTTFYAKSDKESSFNITFSGTPIPDATSKDGKYHLKAGKRTKIVVEGQSAEDVTEGYLRFENTRSDFVYIESVEVGYYPDNHRPQTAEEIRDTINYALHAWCDGLMKTNAGFIKLFDLIDEALDTKSEMENGLYDLKHASDKVLWQDVFGSENYAPVVSKVAGSAYEKYDGDPAKLKFFISETGLEDEKTFKSFKYWIDIWDKNGAKIDGINAKVNLTYSEDAATQATNKAAIDKLLDNLADIAKNEGKLIRLSNFDIKYQDAEGVNVPAKTIKADQRQNLADYYSYVIKSYMDKIPHEKQAGICKGNMVDTTDPVGLWAQDSKSKDWVRTATYKAFCDALSGK